jgi:hypothetical protein
VQKVYGLIGQVAFLSCALISTIKIQVNFRNFMSFVFPYLDINESDYIFRSTEIITFFQRPGHFILMLIQNVVNTL